MKEMAVDRQWDNPPPSPRGDLYGEYATKAKSIGLIAELRGFNGSLESLFPDPQAKTVAAMRNDIEAAEGVRSCSSTRSHAGRKQRCFGVHEHTT